MTTTQPTSKSPLSLLLLHTLPNSPAFQLSWTVLRVAAGLLMIHNGFSKLADVPGFANGVVATIGLPFPVFFTYCAAYTEIIGSILLALGLLTRLSAASLLFTMLIAIYFHLISDGLKVSPLETASLYASIFLLFLVNGGGVFSLDQKLAEWLKN